MKCLRITRLVAAACLLLLAGADPAVASSRLLFILDCSGSMWGRIEDRPKIVIAKEVLSELIREVPDRIHVGLLVYGHRKKGDCGDIELVSGMGGSRTTLVKLISILNAKGKTPIEQALVQAAKVITAADGDNTIILISDGLETCGGDPCGTVTALKENGIALTVHVIGFQVTGKTADQLKCIANAGQGGYFSSDNAGELQSALDLLKRNIVEETPLPEPPAAVEPSSVKATSKRLKLPGPGTVTLKPAKWVRMPPRYWSLVDAETGEPVTRAGSDATRVKPGTYQVAWRQDEHGSSEVLLTATVTVNSSEKVVLPVDTGLRIAVPKGIAPPRWWGLNDADTGEEVARFSGTPAPQVVPAGRYELVWRQKEHGASTVSLGTWEVKPGILNDRVVDMGVLLQPADWAPQSVYSWSLLDQEGNRVGRWRDLAPQLAPPGRYDLVIRPTQHHHNDIPWSRITVPEHGFATISIDSGITFIHGKGVKPLYRIIFTDLDTRREIVMKQTWDSLPLPPGRYRLDLWESEHGSKRQTLVEEFALEPGTLLELEI